MRELSMMPIFSERSYGPPPACTAFVRLPSYRTPTAVRYHHQGQSPLALSDGLARPSGALRGRDCHACVPQPRYRRARAHALSAGRDRGPSTSHSAWPGADRAASGASRTATGDRPRPAYRRCPECPWDHWLVGPVSGRPAPDCCQRRARAVGSPRRRLRGPAADRDAQPHSRGAARLRGQRLRVEVRLAGAGTPTPPPGTALVEPDLLADVPPDVDELLRLLPRAALYLQDADPFACHPSLTRVWCRPGRRGQRLVESPRSQ